MRSLILSVGARAVSPLLLVFSFHCLLRGHNEPGGGFIGGLVAGSAVALWVLADGVERFTVQAVPGGEGQTVRSGSSALRGGMVDPVTVMSVGLLTMLASGFVGLALGREDFLTGAWWTVNTPLGSAKLGTPLLFDLGVYFVVVGVVVAFVFELSQEAPQ